MTRVCTLAIAAAIVSAAACSSSTMPSMPRELTATVPAVITPRVLNCDVCPDPTVTLETAQFDISIVDGTGQGGVVASVDAVVRNMTRAADVGRNRIPNATMSIPSSSVPASGSLTVPMGLSFSVPPPKDDVQMTVTVTLSDGRTATAVARVAPGTS